ncbi:hypothetical protein [Nocardia tenerifensis]|uniref:hypothetical protein n=1 Tax=Nocardia tenerifensis TaxID=228006 RepID=UPI000594CCD9|nr:hypothetical protein [Nocardia tenerifensis]
MAAAGAVAALVAAPGPAYAVPYTVPRHAEAMAAAEAPLTGEGLSIDLNAALDLESQGVTVSAADGAKMADGGITLPVGKGSKLTYAKKVTGGKVLLSGDIEVAKGEKKTKISNVAVDIKTGAVTAEVGGKAGVKIGAIAEPGNAELVMNEGTTKATLKLANSGITLESALLSGLDAALGTALADQVEPGTTIDAALDVDVDLASGSEVNRDLGLALGLDADILESPDSLTKADVDVGIQLL